MPTRPLGNAAEELVQLWLPHWKAPFDWFGQVTAVLAVGALTFGAIEAGATGFVAPRVAIAFVVELLALTAFVTAQKRGTHPMVPPGWPAASA